MTTMLTHGPELDEHFILTCSVHPSGDVGVEQVLDNGLLALHEYAIVQTAVLPSDVATGSDVRLIMVQNPHGHGEYNGPWSDSDPRWTPALLERLGHTLQDDGCFWMAYDDFTNAFTRVDMCQTFLYGDWYHKQERVHIDPECCGHAQAWHLNPRFRLGVCDTTKAMYAYHHCTITVASLHHHCAITVPSGGAWSIR